MAIQISGTTVIDNSRNITSIGIATATTFVGSLSGNATTATTLQTARTINGVSFNGSADITINAPTLTRGSYLTGSDFNFNSPTTWAVDATTTNTASKIVLRDASGNFSAGTISAALSGNATTAATFQTTRTINGYNFTGGANIEVNPSTGACSNGYGRKTVTTTDPTGGSAGDLWIKY